MMSSPSSVQGRLISGQLFPAQCEEGNYFLAKSRCLIDLGNSFLVIPEGDNLSPYQRRIFRLQFKREDLRLTGESNLSKAECADLLRSMLDDLPRCDIVRVDFPFWDRQEILDGLYKDRPCIALFGDDGVPPLFFAAYLETFKEKFENEKFVVCLKGSEHFLPEGAGDSYLDYSKIASFPEIYDLPNNRFKHGLATYAPWPVGEDHLRPVNPTALRQFVVDKLFEMLQSNPHLDYVDTTIQYDIGSEVEGRKLDKFGEWCGYRKMYKGPAEYKSSTSGMRMHKLSLVEKTLGRKQSVSKPKKVTP